EEVITAIIMSILSVELTRFWIKKKLVMKMRGSVPSMVRQAFSALIPGIFVVPVALLINGIGLSFGDSFPELISAVIHGPLQ
ncbi:PTS transporter subunit EIIC, partial [Enterococcus faecalis]|uniref:PTS transporter subunit EIIC n=1 Tax=Enterococcus faecalis TaxID=1351 RepID=UPI003D6A0BCC